MARIPETIHESWHEFLKPLFDDPKMDLLNTQILPNSDFRPEPNQIFRVFKMPMDRIKVVILGQDPYPGIEAIGYAFAVAEHIKVPPSLNVIKQEIINSKVERDTVTSINDEKWKTLKHWRQQGIFLLNTALTVEFGTPNSHTDYWNWFVREVITIISREVCPVWILWGSKAKAFESTIRDAETFLVNDIIKGNHPAVETYPDSKYKFYGCDHFNLCNKKLKEKHHTIINW